MRRSQQGFSLLEAIVALAILASVGLALFAAMNQSLNMVARAEVVRERESVLRNVVSWAQVINPGVQPQGEQLLGDVLMRWRSEPVEPPRDASTGHVRAGLYRVGLYRMHIEVDRDGQPLAELELRRVGYQQIRRPEAL